MSDRRRHAAPPPVDASARAAFDSAKPEQLAVLVHDSLVDCDEPAQKHVLRFQHPRLDVELHVSVEPDGAVIQGVLDRRGRTRALLRFQDREGAVVQPLDGATFEFPPSRHGLVRIGLEGDDEPAVWTDWFRI